jgi:molybdopterin molybdotransferase
MQSVEAHGAEALDAVSALPPREVTLLDAAGCLLAEDVVSGIDMPRFDNSSMDGYAVRVADVAGAEASSPVSLPVEGDVAAGDPGAVTLAAGTTLRIMTGAPMPDGAEAVVPVELTDGGTTSVAIGRVPTPGQHVRRRGEDVRAGQTVLTAGTRIGPRQIALLAAVGRDRVQVQPKPRVVVMPSGNELVPPGKPLGPGQIHDSNGYGLIAAVQELGFEAEHGGVIDDNPESVRTMIAAAARRADLIITTGGVSAGAYDLVKAVLRELGTVSFERVGMQPGMPQGFGTVDGTPIFTLPGNPVSAMVSFEVFVRPVLLRLAGVADVRRASVRARAVQAWKSPPGKRQFARGFLDESGVRPVGGQGSHLVADLAGANCLVVVPEEVARVEVGDEVECFPFQPGVWQLAGERVGIPPANGQAELSSLTPAAEAPAVRSGLTHVDATGAARMVDVSAKPVTVREASASGFVRCSPRVVELLRGAGVPKGDALAVARIAGIQAAKRTPDLVPLAHPVAVHAVAVDLDVRDDGVGIVATVRTADRTGVEMEALTCVTVAGLALIDMVKAVDRRAEITDVRVVAKSGGRSGEWRRD